jgi:hypothetical protein
MQASLHHRGPIGKQPPRGLQEAQKLAAREAVGGHRRQLLLPQIAGFGSEGGEVGRIGIRHLAFSIRGGIG